MLMVALLGLAALAWLLTVRQAFDMGAMVTGLGQVGERMPSDMAPPLFLAMWLTMMVAMMLPTVLPIVLAHRMVVLHRGEGWLPTAAFLLGYLALWTLAGLPLLLAFLGFRQITEPSPVWLRPVAGLVLIAAGAYQFTPWKGACLRACRSPLGFLMTHDFGRGARGAFLAGGSHGAWCLGCCWALMAVLVVVGLMNLAWMGVIAAVFLLEKTWRHGVGLTRVAGSVVALLGATVLLDGQVLSLLANPHL